MNELDRFKIYKSEEDNHLLVFRLNNLKTDFLQLEGINEDWNITVYTPEVLQYDPVKDDDEHIRIIFYNTKYDKCCDTYLYVEDFLNSSENQVRDLFFGLFKQIMDKLEDEVYKKELTIEYCDKIFKLINEQGDPGCAIWRSDEDYDEVELFFNRIKKFIGENKE